MHSGSLRDIHSKLRRYMRFAHGLAKILGSVREVLLHDVNHLELKRSTVACANGYIRGRELIIIALKSHSAVGCYENRPI
ncbi:MAG: PAS domain-containing protein [Synergistaceae bacterium]|jgi:predicted transcriptional regulator YheO|nr:PAS domain-containing protein [Synergistaceae bacterium]